MWSAPFESKHMTGAPPTHESASDHPASNSEGAEGASVRELSRLLCAIGVRPDLSWLVHGRSRPCREEEERRRRLFPEGERDTLQDPP